MSTDLFDNSELETDDSDFAWDEFLPDSDEVETENGAVDVDDSELDVDDSDFDWKLVVDDETELDSEDQAVAAARVEAAFDRIMNTVRRSYEPDSESVPEQQLEQDPELDAELAAEAALAAEAEAELEDALEDGTVAERSAVVVSVAQFDDEEDWEEEEPEPSAVVVSVAQFDDEEDWEEEEAERSAVVELEAEAELEEELEDGLEAERSAVVVSVAQFDDEEDWEQEEPEPSAVFVSTAEFDDEEDWEEEEPEPHAEFLPVSEFDDEEDWEEEEPEPHAEFLPVSEFDDDEEWEEEEEPEPHAEFLPVSEFDDDEEWEEEEPEPSAVFVSTPEFENDAELEAEMELAFSHLRGPVHARSRKSGANERPSGIFIATVVVGCVFLLIVSALAISRSLHHSALPTSGAPANTSQAASDPTVARIQSATYSLDSATTAARAGLASLPGFPTPTNVANVINPYISSLQLYDAFISGTTVPVPVQTAAGVAESQVRHEVAVLSTIDGLYPIRLGGYLNQFAADATRLQAALNTLEQSLRTPTSS